jgi:hypothetical protein
VPTGADQEAARAGVARAALTTRAVARARDLVNEPAGTLTPTRLAALATEWARPVSASVEVLDRDACRKLGMGLFLAVAQGSAEEPRFIHLTWKPPGARRRVVLVGKGVTFDSGGLSLKTNEGMLDMKTDMAGAGDRDRGDRGRGEEKLPIEVHALAACTENMPSGSSYKLGDVIASMAGKTVEINNTDAEGRLTLADALTFGLRLEPDAIVDLATLTGACVVALGPHVAGVMSNDEKLAADWLEAAAACRRGHVAAATAAASRRAAQVGGRRHEEHGGALGRRAHRRPLPQGVRRQDAVGPRRHRGPVQRGQGARPRCKGRNRIRGRDVASVSPPRRIRAVELMCPPGPQVAAAAGKNLGALRALRFGFLGENALKRLSSRDKVRVP